MTTISANQNLGIDLDPASYTNPVVINPGVTISSTADADAVSQSGAGYVFAVLNEGLIETAGTAVGVSLTLGGAVTNASAAAIYGYTGGVLMSGGAGYVLNDGSITATGSGASTGAISLGAGGTVSNAGTGMIRGGSDGVRISGAAGTVVNANTILATNVNAAGVYLALGGSINNASGALISGGDAGVGIYGAAGTVTNYGTVTEPYDFAAMGAGVTLAAGGTVMNAAGGLLTGYNAGVYVSGGAASVINYGSIANTGMYAPGPKVGVEVLGGGSIVNKMSATITGFGAGVGVATDPGTVINDGVIYGSSYYGTGVDFGTFNRSGGPITSLIGSLTNASTGTIAGGGDGVDASNSDLTVVNYGVITSTHPNGHGVHFLTEFGSVTNAASAYIAGDYGIEASGSDLTVVNDGSINGVAHAGVAFDPSIFTASLSNAASASITGYLYGVRVLGASAAIVNSGSIGGTGAASVGVRINAGGSVTNAASASITGAADGVYLATGGTLTNGGTIVGNSGLAVAFGGTGSGLLVLDPGFSFGSGAVMASASASSTLELAAAATAGTVTGLGSVFTNFGSISFDPGAAWTVSGNIVGLAGVISGFAAGDTIALTGVTENGSSFSGGILTLDKVGGGTATLDLPGTFGLADLVISNAGGATDVTMACFRAGTRIRTGRGDVPVEALRAGEAVLAHGGDGRMTPRPIVWIGHRAVDCRQHPKPQNVWPVRVRAGTFGECVPHHDLWLSPDHAVLVNDVLIPIKHLINGTSIEQVQLDEVTYYHVELEHHDVILAEGLPAESYLDTGGRCNFANGGELIALHPDFSTCSLDVCALWEALGCAPLIVTGPKLEAARHLVSLRAPGAMARRVAASLA